VSTLESPLQTGDRREGRSNKHWGYLHLGRTSFSRKRRGAAKKRKAIGGWRESQTITTDEEETIINLRKKHDGRGNSQRQREDCHCHGKRGGGSGEF